MNQEETAGGRFAARLVRASVHRPRSVLAAWLAVAAVASFGVARLEFETAPSSFLDRVSEDWAFYEESLDRFGGDEVIVLAWEAAEPWDRAALADLLAVTREFESLPGVRRADSLASVPVVRARPDGALDLSPALSEVPRSDAERDAVRAAVATDRPAPRSLVSADGRSFAVNILLEADGNAHQPEVVAAATRAAAQRSGFLSGVPVYEDRVGRSTQREILTFVPATLLLMGVLLGCIFRAWIAVAIPAVTSGLGAWALLGAMGAVGEPITLTGMILPSVLLALGTAYVMHVLVAARGVYEPEPLVQAIARVVPPILLSGLTTAVGFFAIMTIRIDAIRALGGYGGIGVLVVLAAALTVGPAMLRLFPLPDTGAPLDGFVRSRIGVPLVAGLVRFRSSVILAWAALLLVAAFGIVRIHVETDAVRWWPPGSEMRTQYDAIRDRFSGISPMNVVIETRAGRRVIEPDVLRAIDGLATYLSTVPDVGKVLSIADPLRQLHGGFVDDPSQPLPEDEELVAQYLLLLESVEQVEDVVSFDRSAANVLLRTNDNGSRALLDVAEHAEAWWLENGPPDFSARVTGIMFEFARSEEAIAWGQIRGLSLALASIGGILLLLFRSLVISGIALVPNVASLGIIYGLMGLFDVPLDSGTVCMGTLALGIAVDDTIHVVDGYRRRRREGADPRAAIVATYGHVLPALVYTSVAIAIGFLALALSGFLLTRNLGLVTAVVVAICLVADTTLLPAVLLGESADGDPVLGAEG
jgi:predicted RND superfamily exporter protein